MFSYGFWQTRVYGYQSLLVALYHAIRLRLGYGFELCDANGPRNVKNTNLAKQRPLFLARFSLLVVTNQS